MISTRGQFSSLIDILRFWAEKEPNRTSFIHLVDESHEDHVTFGELDRRAQVIAGNLQAMGREGARALLLYQTGLDYISALFGCIYAGVTIVPLFPPRLNQGLERMAAIAENSGASLVLTTQNIYTRIGEKAAKEGRLNALSWQLHVDLMQPADWIKPNVSPETLAILQYTSGSTADPKGVQISHQNILGNLRMLRDEWQTTKESVVVGWVPPYHDMGLIGNILHSVYSGARCILMSPTWVSQKPLRWLQAISKYRGTFSGGPNYMYDTLIDQLSHLETDDLDLSSWSIAFNGSEPVSSSTVEKFIKVSERFGFRKESYYPVYGLAEATLFVSGNRSKGEGPLFLALDARAIAKNIVRAASGNGPVTRVVGCGKPVRGQRIVIVDPESRRLCPGDRVGEIWIAGENVTMGYWGNKAATLNTYSGYLLPGNEGPFLRTGDLGFLFGGQLFITGRIKELIILQGNNYFPQDIELSCQKSHEGLSLGSGIAFSVSQNESERLMIVQELKRTFRKSPDLQSVIVSIQTAIARDHGIRTSAVILVNPGSLPKTQSGKLMRNACRDQFLNGRLEVIHSWKTPDA